jgi:hypothetical protein
MPNEPTPWDFPDNDGWELRSTMTRADHEIVAMQLWGWPGWFAMKFVDRLLADRSQAPKHVFWSVYSDAVERSIDGIDNVYCPEGWEV